LYIPRKTFTFCHLLDCELTLVADLLGVSKLLQMLGAACEVSWMVAAAVNTFWGEPMGFVQSFDACCWSHLTHFEGLPQ
jgi:hypothetical protein